MTEDVIPDCQIPYTVLAWEEHWEKWYIGFVNHRLWQLIPTNAAPLAVNRRFVYSKTARNLCAQKCLKKAKTKNLSYAITPHSTTAWMQLQGPEASWERAEKASWEIYNKKWHKNIDDSRHTTARVSSWRDITCLKIGTASLIWAHWGRGWPTQRFERVHTAVLKEIKIRYIKFKIKGKPQEIEWRATRY